MDCTQDTLADILGVTQDSISLWEHDKRIPDTQYIVAMANFFDVTTDFLLGISDDCTGVKFGHEGRVHAWLTPEEDKILTDYRKNKMEIRRKQLDILVIDND
jgi:transcriptional regulator with XRE-family HTH domain